MLDALKLFVVGLVAQKFSVGWSVRYTKSKEAVLVEKEIKDEHGKSTKPPTIKKWTAPDSIAAAQQFPVIDFKCPFCGQEYNWVSNAHGFLGVAPVAPFCCDARKARPIPYPVSDEKFRVHLFSSATLNYGKEQHKFLDTWDTKGGDLYSYEKSSVPWT